MLNGEVWRGRYEALKSFVEELEAENAALRERIRELENEHPPRTSEKKVVSRARP